MNIPRGCSFGFEDMNLNSNCNFMHSIMYITGRFIMFDVPAFSSLINNNFCRVIIDAVYLRTMIFIWFLFRHFYYVSTFIFKF